MSHVNRVPPLEKARNGHFRGRRENSAEGRPGSVSEMSAFLFQV